jgi:hypothetical protein
MLQEQLQKAYELTSTMHECLVAGELDRVEKIASERDALLHNSFKGRDAKVVSDSQEGVLIKEIIELNNKMITLAAQRKIELGKDLDKDLHASSSVKKYIDNMS